MLAKVGVVTAPGARAGAPKVGDASPVFRRAGDQKLKAALDDPVRVAVRWVIKSGFAGGDGAVEGRPGGPTGAGRAGRAWRPFRSRSGTSRRRTRGANLLHLGSWGLRKSMASPQGAGQDVGGPRRCAPSRSRCPSPRLQACRAWSQPRSTGSVRGEGGLGVKSGKAHDRW